MQLARRPERRRSVRVPFQLPLIVQFHNAEGELIQLKAHTQAVNAHGALMLLDAPVKPGQTIHLFNDVTSESVQCYVTSVRERRDRRYVGIGFSSPDCRFWHITFPKAATRPATRSGRTGALIPAARHEPTSLDDLK